MIALDKITKEKSFLGSLSDPSLKLNFILILTAFLFGGLLLFIPAYYILALLITGLVMTFFIAKPQYCYYLIILTIPLTARIRALPISFSINDILIVTCVFAAFINLIFVDKKVNLKTGIDIWIAVLVGLYSFAGIISENSNGILTTFKFMEAIFVFYLTIYFVRTDRIKISSIVKVLIFAALFQAVLSVLQSITGSLGANYRSDRGYLGMLGIGSSLVWHGFGTMDHFNGLGNFLTAIILFFLPIYHFIYKRKFAGKVTLLMLFWGLITTYSRGSLLGLFAGILYFISQIAKNKRRFALILIISLSLAGILCLFLINTSYIKTLSPRNPVWNGIIAAIISSPQYIWIGAGLNSYKNVVLPYLPPKQQWFAHNFYLLCIQEMGLIGLFIMVSFLISMVITTWQGFKKKTGLLKVLNLSVSLAIFSVFFVSMFDHSYSLTFFKILLFLMLGIIHADEKKLPRKALRYQI